MHKKIAVTMFVLALMATPAAAAPKWAGTWIQSPGSDVQSTLELLQGPTANYCGSEGCAKITYSQNNGIYYFYAGDRYYEFQIIKEGLLGQFWPKGADHKNNRAKALIIMKPVP